MTDVMPEQSTEDTEDWGGEEPTQAPAGYPEFPANPHNHRYTISIDSRGPMLVVRANTADEVKGAFEELESGEAGAAIGRAWAAIKAGAALGNGLGATPVPAGAPATSQAPGIPTPPPFGPNVSVPGAPGYQGGAPGLPPAPPAPQGGFGGQQQGTRGPKPRPADWPMVYKIDVPFPQKDAFKAFREQYKDALRGKVAWAGGGAYWIHGDVVQSFGHYNPVPA
ncbi:hypothetical protein AB0E62_00220 [Streptomyces sp. NPDC038707]|uniref:hypothetical protein n=1 Tax=Streptomyces sp. NPDC038707 TaxID=3154329 RepID=UPI0033D656A2